MPYDSVGAFDLPKVYKDYETPGSLMYESHHGSLQYWHSMAPTGTWRNSQVVEMIIGQAKVWYNSALRGDVKAIGKLIHMVSDSYSASHVYRNEFGQIRSFQSYSAQNHALHGTADERRHWLQKYDDVPGVKSAINASTRLLEHYKDGASFAKVEHYLRKAVYALEPVSGVLPAGGSKSVYAK